MSEMYERLRRRIKVALRTKIEEAIREVVKTYMPRIREDVTFFEEILEAESVPVALKKDVKELLSSYRGYMKQKFCGELENLVVEVLNEIKTVNTTISLAPRNAAVYLGEKGRLVASVTGITGERIGIPVTFNVADGIHAGFSKTVLTDVRGRASVSFTANELGFDEVTASFINLDGEEITSLVSRINYIERKEMEGYELR